MVSNDHQRFPLKAGISIALLLVAGTSCSKQKSDDQYNSISSDVIPKFVPEKHGLKGQDIAVIINNQDPLSVKIGEYYIQKRNIPPANVIRIGFSHESVTLQTQEFDKIKTYVDAHTPDHVQAYALTWAKPYRVGCMSITTAFAAGFDRTYCASGCKPTKLNPYFNSSSNRPYSDFGLRPTMAIAAWNFEEAKKLIDRGLDADRSFPQGTAYLVETKDKHRNTRARYFDEAAQYLSEKIKIDYLHSEYITEKTDILFYFTGRSEVPKLKTNKYLPGAITDHLTSAGGMLTDSKQMSSLRWLEAGATGSYGSVVEPCNFPSKFPRPDIVINHYLNGEPLIEAYWKSVEMPGQGIFIGEPLASPFL